MEEDGESPEWFAYTSNERSLRFDANDLRATRLRIQQIVQRLSTRHRRRGGTVSLGGYSQGACMALDVALTMATPLRVALFSGFALLPHLVSSPSGWHVRHATPSPGSNPLG